MSDILQRVADALGQQVAITIRHNKFSSLPFEVVDTTAEPRVLSAWLDHDVAAEEAQHIALLMRARNAVMAMREPTERMMVAAYAQSPYRGGAVTPVEAWRAMVDAALEKDRSA